jgi:hypothetical protein
MFQVQDKGEILIEEDFGQSPRSPRPTITRQTVFTPRDLERPLSKTPTSLKHDSIRTASVTTTVPMPHISNHRTLMLIQNHEASQKLKEQEALTRHLSHLKTMKQQFVIKKLN